jgi:hypothetical protein
MAERFGLALELASCAMSGRAAGADHFQRHMTARVLLFGLEDDAHAAFA